MEIIIAVIGATFTYVITKFILDNLLKQRQIIGEILGTIYHYSMIDVDLTSEQRIKASQNIISLSKELMASTQLIPCYNLLEKIKLVKSIKNIYKASSGLYTFGKRIINGPIDFDELMQLWGNIAIALDVKIFSDEKTPSYEGVNSHHNGRDERI